MRDRERESENRIRFSSNLRLPENGSDLTIRRYVRRRLERTDFVIQYIGHVDKSSDSVLHQLRFDGLIFFFFFYRVSALQNT